MYNASDRKQIRAAEKAAQRADFAKIEFLKSCLSQSGGRQWFWDLLEACHMWADPFTGNPYQEAFLKGERNVGLRIFADIAQHCPDQYISMMREANDRRATLDASISRSSGDSFDDPASAERSGSADTRWDTERSIYLEPTVGDA
jgi:hypothetical protein